MSDREEMVLKLNGLYLAESVDKAEEHEKGKFQMERWWCYWSQRERSKLIGFMAYRFCRWEQHAVGSMPREQHRRSDSAAITHDYERRGRGKRCRIQYREQEKHMTVAKGKLKRSKLADA